MKAEFPAIHDYLFGRIDDKVKEGFNLWQLIYTDEELHGFEVDGFLRGKLKGKSMDVPLIVLLKSLDKQWKDYCFARLSEDPKEIRQKLADLRSVAGCVFLKVEKLGDTLPTALHKDLEWAKEEETK